MTQRTIRLVEDIPTAQDSFGSHDRIASAIRSLIEQEHGGRTIGLEGAWGSGKSSVIKQLSERMSSDSDQAMFIFDTWAHQGDPLRRAFLESLIETILKKGWLRKGCESDITTKQHWDAERDKLSRRIKVTEKHTTPTFTFLGKLVIFLLFLFPIGSALITAAIRDANVLNLAFLNTGLVFVFAPLIAVLIAVLFARIRGKSTDDVWAIFFQKTSTTEHTQTIETPDPTTIEFQEVFKNVLDNSLGEKSQRKLIIVLDNLDRMSENDMDSIWSMLRSFIDSPEFTHTVWFRQLWVIVPYSPEGIKRSPSTTNEATNVRPQDSRSFLEKLIQVKFYVPTPVLSDWKKYLESKLMIAFPHEESSDEFFRIYRLLDSAKNKLKRPRDIISFINEIVAINLQWDGVIPLSHQALYVHCKREHIDIEDAILTNQIPTDAQELFLEGNIVGSLAALVFNIEIEKAMQILLHNKLEKALNQISGETLYEEYINSAGYPEMIDRQLPILLEGFSKTNSHVFCLSLSSIGNSRILDHTDTGRTKALTSSIVQATRSLKSWPFEDEACKSAIVSYIKIDSQKIYREVLLASLKRTSKWYGENYSSLRSINISEKKLENFLRSTREILSDREIVNYLSPEIQSLVIDIGCDETDWFSISDLLLNKLGGDAGKYFSPSAFNVLDAINNSIPQSNFGIKQHAAFKHYLEQSKNDASLDNLLPNLRARLFNQHKLPGSEIYVLYKSILDASSRLESYKTFSKELATSGWLHHHLADAYSENDSKAIGILIFTLLQSDPSGTWRANVGRGANGNNSVTSFFLSPPPDSPVVSELISLIGEYSAFELPYAVHQNNGQPKNLASVLLNKLSENDSFILSFPENEIIEKIDILYQVIPENERITKIKTIVGKIMQQRDLIGYVSSTTFNEDQYWFYSYMAMNRAAENPRFRFWAENGLHKLDTSTLLAAIKETSWLATLIVDINLNGGNLQLGRAYSEAILALARLLAKNEAGAYTFHSDDLALISAIPKDLLQGVTDELYEIAAAHVADNLCEDFFLLFGPVMTESKVLLNRENKPFRRLLLPLVRSAQPYGLAWYIDALEKDISILSNEQEYHLKELIDQLELIAEDSSAHSQKQKMLELIGEIAPKLIQKEESATPLTSEGKAE